MERGDVRELHNICAVDNISSVLEHGILCHAAAARYDHRSVASAEVQARRAQRRIPGGLRLHAYANLYFNARNAMMYTILNNPDPAHQVPAEELVVLRVADRVLDLPDVVVTDINAAANVEPRWHSVAEGLPRIDAEEIFARYWSHPDDPMRSRRHKQRMMAEVLVPHRIAPEHIMGAYVISAEVAEGLTQVAPTLPTVVKPYMFFRGGAP